MKIKHKIILAALMASEYELTSAEVLSGMTKTQAMMYRDLAEIGDILRYSRDKGLVENGNTTYQDRRTVLTWLITEKGREVMNEEENPTVEEKEQVKPHHHQALIDQCDQDKINHSSFWWELWQWKKSNPTWNNCEKNHDTDFLNFQYRRHPHADSIIQWHGCSDEDKKRWQYRFIDVKGDHWTDNSNPLWNETAEYRLKPVEEPQEPEYFTQDDGLVGVDGGEPETFTDDDLKLEFKFQEIRELFAARPAIEPRTVLNLELKIAALTKITEFASDDITALFNDIINDLESIK